MTRTSSGLMCLPLTGIGEVSEGDDLGALLTEDVDLLDGDILVVTSKVVSKAEGRVVSLEKVDALAQETDRVVARRGPTSIVRTHHGLVMAGAGIDNSNTALGTVVLLPVDPDASAHALRGRIAALTDRNVAVVVTDTSGRAWRHGQTDIAIGAAGLEVLHDYAGRTDDYGNLLLVTAPAIADEIAGAADLVKGKLERCPAAVVRGLPGLVLPAGERGPGATQLVREEASDMFGLGAREAVLLAVRADPRDLRGFGKPCAHELLVAELVKASGGSATCSGSPDQVEVALSATTARELGRLEASAATIAFAMGWVTREVTAPDAEGPVTVIRFGPGTGAV
jgi:coenzyme F420-0:L-glutamate ligase/coenzyme F420-1:gamma-L-glutamate ligase